MGRHEIAPRRRNPQPIRRVDPASTTSETPKQAVRRRREASRMVDPRIRRRRRQRLTVTILVALLLVMGGAAFAAWSYVKGLDAKINRVVSSDPALAGQLSADAPKAPGEPFYMLLMGDDRRPGETHARSDTLIVARIDPKAKRVQLLSIPRDSRVKIPGYGAPQKINSASAWGGPALAIKTVKELTGLPISHYLTVDFKGLVKVVDAMGGVWIDIPQRIDERTRHDAWNNQRRLIEKGYQKLNGAQALTYVRARHSFADGDFSRIRNQQTFIKAMVKQGLAISSVVKAPKIVEAVSDNISTDMTVAQLADLVSQFKGMKESDLEGVTVPAHNAYIDGLAYVIIEQPKLDVMIARMRRGEPMVPEKSSSGATTSTVAPAATIEPAEVSVTVKNGAGVSGLAKQAGDLLSKAGFRVTVAGNMNQFVYSKTLVVFRTGADAKAAIVQDELGYGNIVPAAGLYKFETDVMVVVGKDWKSPVSPTRP